MWNVVVVHYVFWWEKQTGQHNVKKYITENKVSAQFIKMAKRILYITSKFQQDTICGRWSDYN